MRKLTDSHRTAADRDRGAENLAAALAALIILFAIVAQVIA